MSFHFIPWSLHLPRLGAARGFAGGQDLAAWTWFQQKSDNKCSGLPGLESRSRWWRQLAPGECPGLSRMDVLNCLSRKASCSVWGRGSLIGCHFPDWSLQPAVFTGKKWKEHGVGDPLWTSNKVFHGCSKSLQAIMSDKHVCVPNTATYPGPPHSSQSARHSV